MEIDYLKPAPCVSTKFLAILRMLIAIALLTQTIYCIVKTSIDAASSFVFISQWNLCLITILFATMAIIEIKHEKRLNNFTVDVKPLKLHESNESGELFGKD